MPAHIVSADSSLQNFSVTQHGNEPILSVQLCCFAHLPQVGLLRNRDKHRKQMLQPGLAGPWVQPDA